MISYVVEFFGEDRWRLYEQIAILYNLRNIDRYRRKILRDKYSNFNRPNEFLFL